ncbi:MAG: hypothetical protein G01um101472_351 [Parcubacteria group bacterium Gr01-1014_72]|nr:MAG: hypothetical protein G01um101472_351 [Parcubacteria group bacterium Gr01-1014_72]
MERAVLLQLGLIALGVVGFAIAYYIRRKKRLYAPLTCPLGSECDTVIHSRYSTILDIPVELLGAYYYTLITLAHTAFLFFPALGTPFVNALLLGTTTTALAFSFYLTVIQLIALKKLCTWCLISATICGIIFFMELFVSGLTLAEFFEIITASNF